MPMVSAFERNDRLTGKPDSTDAVAAHEAAATVRLAKNAHNAQ